jgi:hypothetical protein
MHFFERLRLDESECACCKFGIWYDMICGARQDLPLHASDAEPLHHTQFDP